MGVPVKVGLSLADYYERNIGSANDPEFVDNRFGYFSVGALLTVPLGGTTRFGAWNLHGGVEYQALGNTTKAFNGGDGSRVIGSAASVSRTDERQGLVLDVIFVAVSLAFFAPQRRLCRSLRPADEVSTDDECSITSSDCS